MGTWVAQSVEHATLDFGSGHDLGVLGSSPMWGSVLSGESASGFSLFSAPPPTCVHALSLSQINK